MEAILAGKTGEVRAAGGAAKVLPPETPTGEAPRPLPADVDREPPVPVPAVLALEDALRIAGRCNRDYLQRQESLYLSALALTGARFQFSPRFRSTLSYLVTNATGSEPVDTARADLTASQVLPTGGTLTATAAADGSLDRNIENGFPVGSSLSASLKQPLLRGAGWEASHESLTQAERDVVYSVRDFARYREEFVLDATRRYYGILAQRTVVRNTEERLRDSQFQKRRSEALFSIGRQDKLEVLRAENDLLRVENDLVDARDALSLAMDDFKVFLGLPTTARFEVAETEPPFVPVEVPIDRAVAAALANRFDLANRREQLEDAERALRIAKRNLLPDLSLQASWTGTSAPSASVLDQAYRSQTGSAGLFLEVPLQQTLERNALRSAEIALDRERRDLERFRDGVVVEVRETLRRLRQAAKSLEIQEKIILVEEKRAEKAQIDFDSGRIGNRDLLEARQSLTEAKNDRVRRMVDYELARIELERAMGTLEVGPEGQWRALRAPATASAPAGTGGER